MKPIPFEALHPQEALFMQRLFAQGLVLKGSAEEYLAIGGPRSKSYNRMSTRTRRAIERIRRMDATTEIPLPSALPPS